MQKKRVIIQNTKHSSRIKLEFLGMMNVQANFQIQLMLSVLLCIISKSLTSLQNEIGLQLPGLMLAHARFCDSKISNPNDPNQA
jgi:hypothetical protein